MKIGLISRASVALAGAAAMVVVGGGATAVAQEADDSTGSLTVNGSGVHNDSLAAPTYTAATDPLDFSMWELCDLDVMQYGGPDGTAGPFGACTEVVVSSGDMNIGGLEVPIPAGALRVSGQEVPELEPPLNFPGSEINFSPGLGLETQHGVEYREVPIPGGAFGSADFIDLTSVNASVEAVATPVLDSLALSIDLPVRVKLENPLLGNDCYLGSEQDPIMLQLRPEDGGEFRGVADRFGEGVPGVWIDGAVSADRDFAVPAAQGCGLFGSLNWLVNMRANAPSPAGENSIAVEYDAYNAGNVAVRNWRESQE